MLEQGHRIAGRYRLVRVLAQGGMGSVWVAEDTTLGREVAVKVMVPAAFALPELVSRFHREAKAAAQIKSAHVVAIFDHGVELGGTGRAGGPHAPDPRLGAGQPYIVMELLDGEDLATRLRRVGRLSVDATIDIVIDVCRALRPAHEKGVVHRDLKPANIFFARQDDGEIVKVLDFGVAKLTGADAEKTQVHALLGTPHYMAPEQAHDTGTPVDPRADLWSLGVIAFRAITGQLPFPGENPMNVMMAIVSRAAPAPSTVAPDLGLGFEVDRFFAIALSRDPARRFQSAQAFREAFARLGSRSSAEDARLSRPSDPRVSPDGAETLQIGGPTPGAAPLPFVRSRASAPPPVETSPLPVAAETSPVVEVGTQPLLQLRSTIKLEGPPVVQEPPRAAEPTPAVMSATAAPARPSARRGAGWVIWLAVLGALLAAGTVIVSVVSLKPQEGGSKPAVTVTPSSSSESAAPTSLSGAPPTPLATAPLPTSVGQNTWTSSTPSGGDTAAPSLSTSVSAAPSASVSAAPTTAPKPTSTSAPSVTPTATAKPKNVSKPISPPITETPF